MFKIWVKQYDDKNRIKKHQTFEFGQDFDVKFLRAYVEVVCNELKIETPMILTSHYVTFNNFNKVTFSQSDFVDDIDFEKLTIELIY